MQAIRRLQKESKRFLTLQAAETGFKTDFKDTKLIELNSSGEISRTTEEEGNYNSQDALHQQLYRPQCEETLQLHFQTLGQLLDRFSYSTSFVYVCNNEARPAPHYSSCSRGSWVL